MRRKVALRLLKSVLPGVPTNMDRLFTKCILNKYTSYQTKHHTNCHHGGIRKALMANYQIKSTPCEVAEMQAGRRGEFLEMQSSISIGILDLLSFIHLRIIRGICAFALF